MSEFYDRSNDSTCAPKWKPDNSTDKFIDGVEFGILNYLGLSTESLESYEARQLDSRKKAYQRAEKNCQVMESVGGLQQFMLDSMFPNRTVKLEGNETHQRPYSCKEKTAQQKEDDTVNDEVYGRLIIE